MLDHILAIKRRREDDAAVRVGKATRTLERRQAACRARTRELKEYNDWQETEKSRLFEAVRNKGVTRAELESYRERVGVLRQRQLRLEEELTRAEGEVGAAESDLEKAREKRLDAHREVLKFEEYQGVLDQERLREAERRAETESEDIVSNRR